MRNTEVLISCYGRTAWYTRFSCSFWSLCLGSRSHILLQRSRLNTLLSLFPMKKMSPGAFIANYITFLISLRLLLPIFCKITFRITFTWAILAESTTSARNCHASTCCVLYPEVSLNNRAFLYLKYKYANAYLRL